MFLKIKHHAVPRLKALNNVFEISVRQWRDSTFRCFYTYLKLPFLLHTEAIGQYSSSETVYTSIESNKDNPDIYLMLLKNIIWGTAVVKFQNKV